MLGLMVNANGQTFTSPTGTEYIQPVAPDNIADVTQSISCHTFGAIPFSPGGEPNDLYVWGYGGIDQLAYSGTGVSWKRTNTGGLISNWGNIQTAERWDMEVGIIQSGATIYVVAAYYEPSIGHKYDTYEWTLLGLIYKSTTTLSTSSTYSIISLDAHNLYAIAITWHDGTNLKVKLVTPGGGSGLVGSPTVTISGASNARDQDIAFSHPNIPGEDPKVRIAYIDYTGSSPYYVRVISKPYTSLFAGGTVSFTADDSYLNSPLIAGIGPNGHILSLDCPDHAERDSWSYVIQQGNAAGYPENNIVARIKNETSAPFNVDLTLGGSLSSIVNDGNTFPSVAYDPSGRSINYAWTNSPSVGSSRYVAVKYTDAGAAVGVFDNFKVVSNFVGNYAHATMSKQNDRTPKLFIAYPVERWVMPIVQRDIRHKFVNWTTTDFRPENPTELEDAQLTINEISAYPNPFNSSIRFSIPSNNHENNLEITVYDIAGRVVLKKDLISNASNNEIETTSLPSGTYTVSIKVKNSDYVNSFVMVKK